MAKQEIHTMVYTFLGLHSKCKSTGATVMRHGSLILTLWWAPNIPRIPPSKSQSTYPANFHRDIFCWKKTRPFSHPASFDPWFQTKSQCDRLALGLANAIPQPSEDSRLGINWNQSWQKKSPRSEMKKQKGLDEWFNSPKTIEFSARKISVKLCNVK